MKKSFIIIGAFLFFQNLLAQNIPHANFNAPWGVQVNTYNGNLYLQKALLAIPNQGMSIDLGLTYNSFRDTLDIGFGKGWASSYSLHYKIINTDTMLVERADGRRDIFIKENDQYLSPPGIFDHWKEYQPGKFRLTTKYGIKYYFDNPAHQSLTRSEDTNGNEVTLTYSGEQWTGITDQSGRSLSLTWSGGHLQEVNDANASPQRSVSFTYSSDLLAGITDPEGGQMDYTYNGENTLDHITNERDDELDISYDRRGRVKRIATCIAHITFSFNSDRGKTYVTEKNKNGDRITTYTYDEEGKLLQKTGSCCGYNTQYQYDEDNNVNTVTDGNSNQFTASHDAIGNALFTTDADGAGQAFTFDNTYNRLKSIADKKGNTTSFEYDGAGNLQSIQQPEGVTMQVAYDALGNMISLKDGNGNLTGLDYNPNNDITAIQYPIGGETFEYDGLGNLLLSKDGNDNAVSYEYDGLNRLLSITDDLGNVVRYSYDAASNLESETDPNNNERAFTYDAHHRLKTVGTPSGLTQYGYDASDNLTSITDANQHSTVFEYDQRDLLITESDPLGHTSSYTHDGNGNLLSRTDANGKTTTYSYDNLNRLLSKSYDGNTDNYSYDANGNLIHCSNNNISISFSYDGLNRLISRSTDNWGQTISYEYDLAGNRTKMTGPSGSTIYEYDENNRLTKLTNPAGEITTLAYDPGGRLLQQDYHNGTFTTYGYDIANRLTSLIHQNLSGSILDSYTYTYDGNGNRLTMTTTAGTATYKYDGDNRLLSAQYNGISANDESYQFDGAGNRTTKNGEVYNYDAADRLQSKGNVTYDFDANGNLLQKNENGELTHYFYDGENQLLKVEMPDGSSVEFQYDPFGNRIIQSTASGKIRYLLDGDNVLMELDAGGNTLARYTSALTLDSWISMERNGQSYFYHTDGLGSVTALTNNAQTVEATYRYDAYGNILSQTGTVENPYTYTGREFDAATGLYYYRSRFYDSEVGRFLTRDGFPGFLTRPLSLNKYLYAEGNPINYNDQNGDFLPLLIGIGVKLISGIIIRSAIKGAILGAGVTIGKQLLSNGLRFDCLDYADIAIGAAFGASGLTTLTGVKQLAKGLWKKWFFTKNPAKELFIQKSILYGAKTDIGAGIVRLSASLGLVKYLYNQFNYSPNCEENKGTQEKLPPLPELPPIPGDGTITIPIVRAIDPNEIIPPNGCDLQNWVAQHSTLPYTILYENDPDFATAPAQTVIIKHTFDSDINPFAFRLGDFGFGNYYFEVPDNVSFYSTQIDLSDSLGVLLAVTAGLDIDKNQAFWIFESRDPASGQSGNLPADVGFLPVNDSLSHAGEGFVNFTIKANQSSATYDTIHAQAAIIFDDNPPIATNLAFNLIDADAPVSEITLIDSLGDGRYHLTWTGSDIGSGISLYLLYVSTNQGPFLPIADNLVDTSFDFTGQAGNSYRFFTIATDCAGNTEALKDQGEGDCALSAETTLVQPTSTNANGSITIAVNGGMGSLNYTWFPNVSNTSMAIDLTAATYAITVTDERGCSISLEVVLDSIPVAIEELVPDAELFIYRLFPVPTESVINIAYTSQSRVVWLEVFNTEGRKMLGKVLSAQPGKLNEEQLDVKAWAAGSYLVRIQTKDKGVSAIFVKQ